MKQTEKDFDLKLNNFQQYVHSTLQQIEQKLKEKQQTGMQMSENEKNIFLRVQAVGKNNALFLRIPPAETVALRMLGCVHGHYW